MKSCTRKYGFMHPHKGPHSSLISLLIFIYPLSVGNSNRCRTYLYGDRAFRYELALVHRVMFASAMGVLGSCLNCFRIIRAFVGMCHKSCIESQTVANEIAKEWESLILTHKNPLINRNSVMRVVRIFHTSEIENTSW